MEIREFVEKLGSSDPTPGGGAAAALVGSVSAALVSMVASVSLKSKRPRDSLKGVPRKAMEISERFLDLMKEDEKAFEKVAQVLSKPRDESWKLEMDKALELASEVPIRALEQACQLKPLVDLCVREGKRSILSDAVSAKYLLEACAKAFYEMVRANAGWISNKQKSQKILREAENLLSKVISG